MSYEMTGVIKRISAKKEISEKYSFREFILFIAGDYPQNVKFQLANKRIDLVDESMIGKEAIVHFNINGKATATGYWNTLFCWKVVMNEKNDPYVAEQPAAEDLLTDDEPF